MRKSTKTTLIIVVISMAVVMLLGFATSGFTNWNKDDMKAQFEKQVNPDNFYTADCLLDFSSNDGYGIVFEVDQETGAIKVDGVAKQDYTVEVAKVTLDKGTYTFTAVEDAGRTTMYMNVSNGSVDFNCDFSGNTVTIENDNTVLTLELHIVKDTKVSNVTVLPVIVAGEEAGEFFK